MVLFTMRFARTNPGHCVSTGVGVSSSTPLRHASTPSPSVEEDQGAEAGTDLGLQGLDSLIVPGSESAAMANLANYPTWKAIIAVFGLKYESAVREKDSKVLNTEAFNTVVVWPDCLSNLEGTK
uniref:Uncharacterized protein n=1 Tax=Oryza glumipatula TaxID=40148 RepID=A0A0E0BHR2_9ORYZ